MVEVINWQHSDPPAPLRPGDGGVPNNEAGGRDCGAGKCRKIPAVPGRAGWTGRAAGSDVFICTLSQLPKHRHVQTMQTMAGTKEFHAVLLKGSIILCFIAFLYEHEGGYSPRHVPTSVCFTAPLY